MLSQNGYPTIRAQGAPVESAADAEYNAFIAATEADLLRGSVPLYLITEL